VLWTFRCYVSGRGVDEIKVWYDALSPKARAKFDNRVGTLRRLPRHLWKREPFDLLAGECDGLGEIRFEAENVQHRSLGFFSPGHVFTLVIGAIEKGGKFVPRNACAIGLARRAEIKADKERSHACNF
jgi:hypothetical protein